jgi:tetratricopeptide (TPR) repeat protein
MLTNHPTEGIAECEQALALDRNLAEAHAFIGWAKSLLGRSAETEAHTNEALRLSPRDIYAFRWMNGVGIAKSQMGADAEAVAWLRRSIEANPNQPMSHFLLAAVLARLGDTNEARAAMQVGLARNPGFTIHRFRVNPLSDDPTYVAWRERMYDGMRMAGVPEGRCRLRVRIGIARFEHNQSALLQPADTRAEFVKVCVGPSTDTLSS